MTPSRAIGESCLVDLVGEAATSPRVASSISVRISTELRDVERTWKSFEEYADGTVFQSFDWLSQWQRHIGAPANVMPVIAIASDEGGVPLIILPLSIRQQGRLRHLTWLGDDLCDYNGPLLSPLFGRFVCGHEFIALWRRILGAIRGDNRLKFDLVSLQRLPEMIGMQRNPFLSLPLLPNTFGAHLATLGTNWDEFYQARRPAKDRKVDRRKFRNLAKYGELRFIEPKEPNAIARTMDLLIRQKRDSYARIQARDIFARPGYCEFFKSISILPALASVVHVTRLDVGDMPVATGFGLCYKSRYYLVLSSYEDNRLALYSPGRAHLCDLMRWAIARRCKLFDFTIGDEPYKREWSDIEVRLFDLLQGVTLLGWLSIAGKGAMRRADLFICKRPALRGPLSRIRRQLGALRRGVRLGSGNPDSRDGDDRRAI